MEPTAQYRRRSLWLLLLFIAHFTIGNAQVTRNFECKSSSCCDQHEWCKFWASIGECDNNRSWMAPNCQIACNSCGTDGSGSGSGSAPQPPKAIAPQQTLPTQTQPQPQQTPPQAQTPIQTQSQASGQPQVSAQPQGSAQSQTPIQTQQPKATQPPTQTQPPQTQQTQNQNQIKSDNPTQRCNQIRSSADPNAVVNMKKEALLVDKEDVSFRKTLSLADIASSNSQLGCAPQQEFTDCNRNACYNVLYRTMDGSCNNFDQPFLGAAATPFMRLKPPVYDDGNSAPTSSIKGGRPSAREASRFLLSSAQVVTNNRFNMLVMQFGQFVVHDITKTSLLPTDQCVGCTEIPGKCFPIRVEPVDPRFGCQQPPCCLSFTRSSFVCGSQPRAQLNEQTSFLDASLIYGQSMTDANRLREGAFLRSSSFNNKMFLPFNQQQCSGPGSCAANFDAGDNRVTIFVGLVAFHTVFMREHNRIAKELQAKNPAWSPDRVYHETRKIIGAVLQAIAYKEWLPKIMGSQMSSMVGPYQGYDPNVVPTISDEFSSSAMRFGHGMIQEFYPRLDSNGQNIAEGGMKFDDGVLRPSKVLFEGGVDPILRGLMTMAVKRPQRLTTALTERMFGSSDLAAINIQRGRDAGVPSYNEWREFCGLKRAKTFDDLAGEILDKAVRDNVQQGFHSPDNVDLYVGAIIEDPVVDGMVGPTVACLIGDQFKRIRAGDRFWYQNPGVFTPAQLSELEKVTLSRILCDNGDNFQFSPKDAFEVATGSNLLACNTIAAMDLSKWSD